MEVWYQPIQNLLLWIIYDIITRNPEQDGYATGVRLYVLYVYLVQTKVSDLVEHLPNPIPPIPAGQMHSRESSSKLRNTKNTWFGFLQFPASH